MNAPKATNPTITAVIAMVRGDQNPLLLVVTGGVAYKILGVAVGDVPEFPEFPELVPDGVEIGA